MKELDDSARRLLKELVKDPRASDNRIARKTGIPLKTVNRKRKELERDGILNYAAWVNNGPEGTGEFSLPQLYIVTFSYGVTRKALMDSLLGHPVDDREQKHIITSYVGESGGRASMIMLLASRLDTDILEIFNAEIAPKLRRLLGHDCIHSVQTYHISHMLSLLNNYLPLKNMDNGKIRPDWPESLLFVG
jgi:hypothetical protein